MKSQVEQVNHLTSQDLDRKLKEKKWRILINEEGSLSDERRKLKNNLMQVKDVPNLRE